MDDHIITIGDSNGFDGWRWKMTIDLKELASSAGIRKPLVKQFGQVYNKKVVSIPMSRAKKLLKLIHEHCTDPEIVSKYLARNKKLYEYWRSL